MFFPQGYQRASLITPSELTLIKNLDRQPRPKQAAVFAAEQETYAELFLGLLGKLVRVDTVQAVLVGMGDMMGEYKDSIRRRRGWAWGWRLIGGGGRGSGWEDELQG